MECTTIGVGTGHVYNVRYIDGDIKVITEDGNTVNYLNKPSNPVMTMDLRCEFSCVNLCYYVQTTPAHKRPRID